MKIIGDTRPYTDKTYHYSMMDNKGKVLKVETWQIFSNKVLLKENSEGKFTFGTSTAGKTLTLVGKVKDSKTGNLVSYSISIVPLMGIPKILDVYWKDINGKRITNRAVGYLDKVTLVIKTTNIPVGDRLKVTVYEDEYVDGHSERTSRNMGEYFTKGITKNGYAYIVFDNIKVYQKKLNDMDYKDEPEHEFYIKVQYSNNKINLIKDDIFLKIKNQPVQMIKPYTGVKPVMVGDVERLKKNSKNIDVVFNMFFDGTLNNMNNTTKRIEGKTNKKDDSYLNFYSNVALLYMTLEEMPNTFNIYTEGIGTENDKYDEYILPTGKAFGLGDRGIEAKVAKGITEMQKAKETLMRFYKKEINKATINVFGFSRGAAGARHFVTSKIGKIKSALGIKEEDNIKFNFVGIFDTVASFGFVHWNDVYQLDLDLQDIPKKVFHLVASDEYRENFKLTDISSSIHKGVGYQLSIPGVHSDIGGGYAELEDEIRILKQAEVYKFSHLENEPSIQIEFEQLRQKYISEGWYLNEQIKIEDSPLAEMPTTHGSQKYYVKKLIGTRKQIPNTYQYIGFEIMRKFAEKYCNAVFDKGEIAKNFSIKDTRLLNIKNALLNYAIKDEGVDTLCVSVNKEELRWLRNHYLHFSNRDDSLTMYGRYDKNNNPNRDILAG